MKTFKELFVTTDKDRKNVIEEATWGDARLASVDAKRVLEKNKFEVSKITSNGFKLTHKETGCVGSVVFDPALEESALDESRTISGIFVVDSDSKEQPAKITLDFSTLNSQKNGMLKITAGGKTYELHVDGDLTKLL